MEYIPSLEILKRLMHHIGILPLDIILTQPINNSHNQETLSLQILLYILLTLVNLHGLLIIILTNHLLILLKSLLVKTSTHSIIPHHGNTEIKYVLPGAEIETKRDRHLVTLY